MLVTKIIAKRIDSETAWLSHRMILRDIHRFKDLNEGAISEIKQKEEYFKEAVTRIMTSKFGLFRDAPKQNQPPTAKIGDRPSSGVVDFVQHMDESKRCGDIKDEDASDIARLEESLRSEMLNMANGASESVLESQLDLYDNAVKKVRRMNMSKAAKAVKKLSTLMKMAKLAGAASPSAALTEESETVHEDDEVV
ncbi:hypothetical protein DYB32_001301 [Aphanomyces invadans]|uniref:Uncharacterized protein n=1 Tax=Aphanomyces invadans TaxID=157072 RepID=A0A418B817_9STRA|nr:hypothetical protein DYB32_001301 [Aphanomyces invadans]